MKQIKINVIHYLLTFIVLGLLFSSCTKSVKLNELTSKNGLFYLKNDTIPFSGKIQNEYISGKDSLKAKVESGLYNGDYLIYYPTGEIKDSVKYTKGTIVKYKRFLRNGLVMKTLEKLLFQSKRGLTCIVDENKDTVLFSGLALRTFQDPSYPKGKVFVFEENYINGKMNGNSTGYYPNGKLYYTEEYKNGKQNGRDITYYENGKLEREANWKDGLTVGKWTTYHKNGKIEEVGLYKNDQKDSTWNEYYENGKIKTIAKYVNGEYNGPYTAYYDNGKLKVKGSFTHGNKDGDWTWYYVSGAVENQGKFQNGEVMRKCYCCGRYYVQSEGWNARPSGVNPNLWAFMCDQPQLRGGPYCSQGCAERCRY